METTLAVRFEYESLDQANRINRHKTAIQVLEEQMKRNILEIGQHLAHVQEELRHNKQGGFQQWVEAELGWSIRTAYNYLSVFLQFGNRANFAQLGLPTSAMYVLAAQSTPEEAREEILQRAEQGEQLSFKQIEETVRQARRLRLAAQQAGKVAPMSAPTRTPSTFCAWCRQGNLPVYASDTSGIGICLTCAQQAVKFLSK